MTLQYLITPDYDPDSSISSKWADTTIGFTTPVSLTGHTIGVRYREGDEVDGYTYPTWYLISQTLTPNSPHNSPNPYTTELGTELYTVPSGTYIGTFQNAGITDGTAYSYVKVFDQTQASYIPRLSSFDSVPIDGQIVPIEPYNPPTEYPIDALTRFNPDTRSFVTISYTLTTTWSSLSPTDSSPTVSSITLSQDVYQSTNNWSSVVQQYVDRTHFKHGSRPSKP